ncbi:phage major capsid protein [Alkalibacillus salilacus]|uniref:HK97 family phage major capsid protein n=1 Tax=Alkalibacillus salilacus TaxID=284582 RepID=A0ABT9VDB6_9BACI|nr:phage major capsid protein [Alkalibacillus salilacus]MDQ0158966.1 HK97 family phage major capsid protein [Alkalibacillus salilacus]
MEKKKQLSLNLQYFNGEQKSRLKEIEERQLELSDELDKDDADVDAIEKELRELKEEKEEYEKRQRIKDELKDIKEGKQEKRTVETFNLSVDDFEEDEEDESDVYERHGKALLEKRAVTVSSGNLVTPDHDKPSINDSFNQVSTLIDRVQSTPLDGGESYQVPFEIQHGEGNYTAEGDPYFDVTHEFGYADINKAKVTAYSEVTEEVEKLPRADYAQRVLNGVRKAVRKKATKEILVGQGGTNEFAGIFSTAADAINPATDIEVEDVDETTLDNIIYSYGGDEDVEDEAVLILSKDDVRKFAMLRDVNERKVYEVVNNGNTGTINGVQYVINSAATGTETAADGDFVMAYGPLSNYEMAVFSQLDVKRSDDFKFKEGMIAHRASVMAGGNVVAHNGFLRVKKVVPA